MSAASSGGLTVEGRVDVRCTREEAWELCDHFERIAALIPSVEAVEVEGALVHARVETRLGALPISSRVTLEVTERREGERLRAEGMSYLGETIKEQIKKDVAGVAKDSVGRLCLQLDLVPSERPDHVAVVYHVRVEARGRLKRIYRAILKTKVPAMMEQFAENIRGALEGDVADAASGASAVALTGGAAPSSRGWWSRFLAWLWGLFGSRRRSS